jgi:hypothetical protein
VHRTDASALVFLLFTVFSMVSAPAAAVEADSPERYAVAAIRAHAYYHARGEFDERDLFDPTLVLRNVIIGEGDAREPTEITLVLVVVEGPSFASETKGAVELRTRAAGTSPAQQSMPLSLLFAKGTRVTVPFLIQGTGCEHVELEARITGVTGDPPPPKKATIPFHCGE